MNNEKDITIEPETDADNVKDPAEAIKKLKGELVACRKEREEYLAGWQRAKADFINAEREANGRSATKVYFTESDLLKEFLSLADSFETALKREDAPGQWLAGMKNMYELLLQAFALYKVTKISTRGEKFDPRYHEAVATIEADDEEKDDSIIEEIQTGYVRDNEILRPAKVKVAKFKNRGQN